MKVAVAIVSYHGEDDVLRCLVALGASDFLTFEVVICENGGAEACESLSKRLPKQLAGGQAVRLVPAKANLGFAGGVNLCIAQASDADAWWILNPDTEPEPSALRRLVERLSAGDCDAVGGVLSFPDGRVQSLGGVWRRWAARAVSLGRDKPLAEAPRGRAEVERRQNFLSGASMLVSRRFWEMAGPLREDYFLYCEEVEWCLRARARGARLGFAPEARVMHRQGTSTGHDVSFRRQARMPVYLNERNRLLLTRDLFPATLPVAAAVAFGLIFLRFARRGAWRQLSYAIDGWRAGLAGERGRPAWARA